MTSRADERAAAIREALDALERGEGGVGFVMDAPANMAWLLAERERLTQALVDLHESLFIGSERGLTKRVLADMAAFAKREALAGADGDA